MKFQVPAIISKITTMADKSLRLQVDTQELSHEEKANVFEMHDKFGYFLMQEALIREEDLIDIPEVQPEFKGEKTPSKRLRDRLFVYFEATHTDKKEFEDWYKKEMDRIGQHYLDKIQ